MRLTTGYPEILVCTFVWGLIGVIARGIEVPSATIVFFRVSFGFLVVLGWLVLRRSLGLLRPRARGWLLVASGVVLGTHWATMFEGFKRIEVAPTILIVFVGPVLMAVAAPAVLGERLRASVIAALAVAFGGAALIFLPEIGRIDPVGIAAASASAVLFAVLVLMGKLLTRDYEPAAIVAWQLGVATVLMAPSLAGTTAGAIARDLPLLALLGAGFTGLLGILYFRAIRALPAQRLSVLFYLEPATAVLYAWWLLGERPTPAMLAGGVLIMAAGLAIIVGDRRSTAPAGLPEPIGDRT